MDCGRYGHCPYPGNLLRASTVRRRTKPYGSATRPKPGSEAGSTLTLTASLMGEYMERWLEGPLKRSVATSTYEDYAYRTRKYVIPALGNTKLKDLTAEHLDGLYEQKSASGLSPRSVNFIHSMICVALQRAVKKRLIPYTSPVMLSRPNRCGGNTLPCPGSSSGLSSGSQPRQRIASKPSSSLGLWQDCAPGNFWALSGTT
jgi:integrase-like protein